MEQNTELLKPKIDVVFHSLFRIGNEKITKAIISAVTKEKIEHINLNNDRNIIWKYSEEKLGILDLKATLDNGVICNIEIQLADNKDTAERFLFYWSRIYSSQLLKGDKYEKLNKVIGIIIIDYPFEKTKEIKDINTKWKIREVTKGKEMELTDVLELHIIEIQKAREILKMNPKDKLAQWMVFFNDPNEKEVSKIINNNEEIKEAMDELKEISQNEELRRIAELREKAIRDEANALFHATKEGKEEGLKQGRQQGKEEGLKQGTQKGKEQAKIEIVKNMLKKNIEIDFICEVVGLNKEEVQKIQENKV